MNPDATNQGITFYGLRFTTADHASRITNHAPNFWRTEPNLDADPFLATRRRALSIQHVYYLGETGEALGMIRRVPEGFYRTVWFSAGQGGRKRHHTLSGAKRFLERKFSEPKLAAPC